MDIRIVELKKKEDQRGYVLPLLARQEMDQEKFGEILFASINPGEKRGDHYHKEKEEWFFLVNGKARLRLQHVESGEKQQLDIDSANPVKIFMGKMISHSVENIGDEELVFMEYFSKEHDEANPDNHKFVVED